MAGAKVRYFWKITLMLVVICSCNKKVSRPIYYEDKTFTEIANETKTPFCIILRDTLSLSIDKYMESIQRYSSSSKNTVFHFINTEKEQWLHKLLLPRVYPVTCIFNSYGKLIDLIPGDTKESFIYISQVLEQEVPNSEFHYNQKYDQEKMDYIDFMNSAIELKDKVDDKIDVVGELDSLFQMVNHPYILYMKLQNQLQTGKDADVTHTAKKLLGFDTMYDKIYFHEELFVASMILDSTLNYTTAPMISSETNVIKLDSCKQDMTYRLNAYIYNKGKKDLNISEIHTSCSCIEIAGEEKIIVTSGDSYPLSIEFTPDAKGNVYREVYIISNSLNTPVYTISVEATVI